MSYSQTSHAVQQPANRAAQFWRTRERPCINQVRYLLSMRSMLLGNSFQPRPNRHVHCSGLVMMIGFLIKANANARCCLILFFKLDKDLEFQIGVAS